MASITTLSCPVAGLKEGEPVSDADAGLLAAIMEGAFPEAGSALVVASISGRPQRLGAYAVQQ